MRLDHLLSKEKGRVRVGLLLICQGKKNKEEKHKAKEQGREKRGTGEPGSSKSLGSEKPRQVPWNNPRTKLVRDLAKCSGFLVAMRLGETPVPIPNTMVKT